MSTTTDLETVRALAQLARLSLAPEELERFAPELERILNAFEVLARHAPAAPQTTATLALPRPAVARTREDVAVPCLEREALLDAASASADGFFVVPKTVGGER